MKYLYGASGHAKVIVDVIDTSTEIILAGIFDDDNKKKSFLEIPFLGKYDTRKVNENAAEFLVSIGDNKIRKTIVKILRTSFFSAFHKSSVISSSATIGTGTVIMPKAVINTNSKVGDHCIINTSAVVEHDCIIENYVHISPNATVTGGVEIGEGTHVGAGAIIIPGLKIGKWSVIGAGAVIINDIPENSLVVGNPGKVIRKNNI
jgi:acetyltransferase EpsM